MQEEDEKENAMGLADTDWLKSPHMSTPASSPRPCARPLQDNSAAAAAAANTEENLAGDNDATGPNPTSLVHQALLGPLQNRAREPGSALASCIYTQEGSRIALGDAMCMQQQVTLV